MPRLSLYRPEKGNDFKFLDRIIEEQFQVGGTDIFVHRYMGPPTEADGANKDNTPSTAGQTNGLFDELSIQDVILMENRDRKYDPNVYVMRGIYTMQDLDFNLSQFGIFLSNDNIFLHFHLRNTVETLGRKIMAGDVLELPHLKDEYALDAAAVALKRFYVVQDVTRASTGFSQTWYPHLLRVKCAPLVDTQEYADILNADAGAGDGTTIRDLMSTYNQNIAINDLIVAQAEEDAPLSGYDTQQFYVLPENPNRTLMTEDATNVDVDASNDSPDAVGGHAIDASMILKSPTKDIYVSYLNGDGRPPNGAPYTFGIEFPTLGVVEGQFHLRTDYYPNRLFRFNGRHWMKYEDNVRMTLTNAYDENTPNKDATTSTYSTKIRQTQRTGFINNNNVTGTDLKKTDIFRLINATTTIQTDITFTEGMNSTVFVNELPVNSRVTAGSGGNALITMIASAAAGSDIQYRLFGKGEPERQALSKILKPKADN